MGIDIGNSSIKVVELSRWGERRKLENYGEMKATALYKEGFRTFEKNTLLLSNRNIARAIKAILNEAEIKTRQVIFPIPNFSSFFTNFELPPMSEEELLQAVTYEARRHVPVPLGEVTLDWQIIKGPNPGQKKTNFKILLVAVPNESIHQYQVIAQMTGLELFALEAEVFGLLRSLIKEQKDPIALVDIGAQASTCSIVEKKTLKLSHGFDLSGNGLTELIAKSLAIDYEVAERIKKKHGILANLQTARQEEIGIRRILLPLVDIILREVEKICRDFYQTEKREVKKIILAGGTALLPGLKEYSKDYFKKEIEIANPFSNIFYPPILEKTLKQMGPSYATAVGLALRGLE